MRKLFGLVALSIFLFIMLSGCTQKGSSEYTKNLSQKEDLKEAKNNDNKKISLTIWASQKIWDEQIKDFKKKNPNTEVNLVVQNDDDSNNLTKKYLEALASQQAPDVFMIQEDQFDQFNSIEGLEDLLSKPYNAGHYKEIMTKSQWDRVLSLDGKKLYALPLPTYPIVTYYRKDIFSKYGLPSEPDKLGQYIKDSKNLISILRALKDHGKWGIRWKDELVNMDELRYGFFDKDMNFIRNTPSYIERFELSKVIQKEGLSAQVDVWSFEGQEAIRSGEIVMLFLGSWGEDNLKAWAPETKGNWRVTGPPLDMNGNWGGFCLAIASQSTNKKEAWELVKYLEEYERSHVESSKGIPSEILGGQMANKFYDEVNKEVVPRFLTPLDKKTERIWKDEINIYINSEESANQALKNIEDTINDKLGDEKKDILNYLKSSR